MNHIDLTGERFGKLLVLKFVGRTGKNKNTAWLCRCDCGREKTIITSNLTGGRSLSCGCNQKEFMKNFATTHGMSKTRLYKIYKSIKQRCYNKNNPAYKYYGDKGVTLYEDWKNDYMSFHNWAMKNGFDESAEIGKCTIDRIDPNGNYEPNNCRWVTIKKQQNNKVNSAFITIGNQRMTVAEWADYLSTNKPTLYSKFYRLFEQLNIDTDNIYEVEFKLISKDNQK